MESKIKHLEFIQGVITRMANNSFKLKVLAVTLITGILALATNGAYFLNPIITFIPIIVFWGLDAYYLQQKRMYRSLYEKVRQTDIGEIDFSLKATLKDFDIPQNHYCKCLRSKTELWFYLPLAIVCLCITIYVLR